MTHPDLEIPEFLRRVKGDRPIVEPQSLSDDARAAKILRDCCRRAWKNTKRERAARSRGRPSEGKAEVAAIEAALDEALAMTRTHR